MWRILVRYHQYSLRNNPEERNSQEISIITALQGKNLFLLKI
jgi:hypothetical protein